jgi:hypothetical protein
LLLLPVHAETLSGYFLYISVVVGALAVLLTLVSKCKESKVWDACCFAAIRCGFAQFLCF